MKIDLGVIFLVVLLGAGESFAADTHPTYNLTDSPSGRSVNGVAWQNTSALVSDAVAANTYQSGQCNYVGSLNNTALWKDTGTGATVTLQINRTTDGLNGCSASTLVNYSYTGSAICATGVKTPTTTSPVMCLGGTNCPKDTFQSMNFNDSSIVGDTPPVNVCNSENSCSMVLVTGAPGIRLPVVGSTDVPLSRLWQYKLTGNACDPSNTSQKVNGAPAGDNPIEGADGDLAKHGKDDTQVPNGCIRMNGDMKCVNAIGPIQCVIDAAGAMICGNGAATPPAPNTGTPGTPATPEFKINVTDSGGNITSTYNYYSSNTVTGSSDSGSGADQEGTGGNGVCGGVGQPLCGESSSGDPCGAPGQPECAIKDPCDEHPDRVGCVDLGEPTPGNPIPEEKNINVISPVTVGGSGSCPADIVTAFMGQTITIGFDNLCTLASYIKPMVLALAWLSAGLIFVGGIKNG